MSMTQMTMIMKTTNQILDAFNEQRNHNIIYKVLIIQKQKDIDKINNDVVVVMSSVVMFLSLFVFSMRFLHIVYLLVF